MDDTTPDPAALAGFSLAYHPLTTSDIATSRAVPPPMLIADLIRSRSIILISGEPFSGKTLFTLSLVLSLDMGTPFLDTFHPAPGHRCLFLGQDAPTWDYFNQVAALSRGLGVDSPSGSSLYILNRGLSLNSGAAFLDFVSHAVSLYDIDVLCLDTMKAFHDADENSNMEMSHIMNLLKLLRDRFSLTILLTHHTSKPFGGSSPSDYLSTSNYRARGASVIAGSIDQHFILSTHGDAIRFVMPKARGASSHLPINAFSIRSGPSPTGPTLRLSPTVSTPSLISIIPGLLATPQSVNSLFTTLRSDIRFSHLTDAQLYNRITSTLRTLHRRGAIQSMIRGLWSVSSTAPPGP